MVLVRQRYADESIKKYKARLVANGNRQQIHAYNETTFHRGGNGNTYKEVRNFKRRRDTQEPAQQLENSCNY
jgi:hypothetical protein